MASELDEELRLVGAAAQEYAGNGEELTAVMAAQAPASGRSYLCAFAHGEAVQWLVLDARGTPVVDAALVREAVSLVAMCELAEENAGGGDVADLRKRLAELRQLEHPEGIEEAEEAAAELERTIESEPRVARADYLDALGQAAMRLERTLGETTGSPFTAAMQAGMAIVDGLVRDVVDGYKHPLDS